MYFLFNFLFSVIGDGAWVCVCLFFFLFFFFLMVKRRCIGLPFFFMVTRVFVSTKDHCSATSVGKSLGTLTYFLYHESRKFQISPNFATTNPFREGSRGSNLAIWTEGRAIPGFSARVDSELI